MEQTGEYNSRTTGSANFDRKHLGRYGNGRSDEKTTHPQQVGLRSPHLSFFAAPSRAVHTVNTPISYNTAHDAFCFAYRRRIGTSNSTGESDGMNDYRTVTAENNSDTKTHYILKQVKSEQKSYYDKAKIFN